MKTGATPGNRLHKVRALRHIVLNHQSRERLAVVVPADGAERETVNVVGGEVHAQAVGAVEEETSVAVGVGVGSIEALAHHAEIVLENAQTAIAASARGTKCGARESPVDVLRVRLEAELGALAQRAMLGGIGQQELRRRERTQGLFDDGKDLVVGGAHDVA